MSTDLKILIAGSTGLLGRNLAGYLSDKADIITHGYSQEAQICADLTEENTCKETLDTVTPDVVINLIALTNVDDCEKQHQKSFNLNIRVPDNISHWCAAHKKNIIHISTDQLYNGPNPSKEEDITLLNNYALSKRAGELPVLWADGVVLRTNFFGKSLSASRQSFSDWLRNSFKQNAPLQLFNDVNFSPLHIKTLCKEIWRVIVNPVSGIFNVGSRNGMSKEEFARRLAQVLGYKTISAKSVSFKDANLSAARPCEMRMDVSKYERMYKVTMPTLLDEINVECANDIQ